VLFRVGEKPVKENIMENFIRILKNIESKVSRNDS
jgi:hypothetical protein